MGDRYRVKVNDGSVVGLWRISERQGPATTLLLISDHGAAMDAILELLEGAGPVEVYVNTDGKQAMRLTDAGGRVARQMAMSDDPDGLLGALLEAQSET